MPATNTTLRYGGVAKGFHWLTALLILTLIPLGWWAERMPYDTEAELARKAFAFSLHKTLGVTVFFVALARILWTLTQPRPALLNGDKRLESTLAEMVHWLLYGALVIVPLSGWIGHAAAEGFAPIWWPFGQGLPLIPKSTQVEHLAGAVHFVAGRLLIAALLLHVAGALKHHVIDRDATLRRMLPGTAPLGPVPDHRASRLPALLALLIWAAAVALGAALAAREGPAPAPAQAELGAATSEWQVQEGSIAITVRQFGKDVTGQFADWTADISFDETLEQAVVGAVEARVAVGSLTLGSVTDQAMGPDFLAAESHPVAVYAGDIARLAEGYQLTGRLTLKGAEVPLDMPFSLDLDGDRAEARGTVTLDRRDFGIGESLKGEDSLGFAVDVVVTLTAERGA